MKNGYRYSHYIWLTIFILMIIGFISSILYWLSVYTHMGIILPSCGCHILTKNDLLFLMIEFKASILGVKPIYLSLVGFPIGASLAFYAWIRSNMSKTMFMIISTGLSVTYIPYLIYLFISHGVFCIYCSIMHATIISSAILSVFDYIKRGKLPGKG